MPSAPAAPQAPASPSAPQAPPSPSAPQAPIAPPAPSLPSQPAASPRITEVPLLECSGLPCIDIATASGKTLRLLIDTGEVNSYLDSKTAQSLAVELQPLKGNNDTSISQVQQTIVPGAKLGELPLGDFPFMVLDTTTQPEKLGEKLQPFPADGALTYGAFKNRLLQIDYIRHLVRVSEPQDAAPPCPQNCSELVIKHFGNYGPVTLTTTGFTLNGQPLEVQVDTLFTGTMLVYPASVEKLGLKKQAKGKHKEFFPFTQGGLKLSRADGATAAFRDLPLVQDAPVYFFTAEDHPPAVQFDATVGSALLSHAVVTFDFKGMHMWMEAGTTPAGPR